MPTAFGLTNVTDAMVKQDRLAQFTECMHSVRYRITKDSGVIHELETRLIPAVPQSMRHSSSWSAHFRGEGPANWDRPFFPELM